MKVVCVATSRNQMLDHWESSAKQWGYEIDVIGEGTVWEGFFTNVFFPFGALSI